MDNRKLICKCTKCKTLYIDTIPNDKCLRMKEDELPKRMKTLVEDGCPECLSWDYLEDVFDEVVIIAHSAEEAKEKTSKLHPDAYFLKAIQGKATNGYGTNTLLKYLFLR